MATVTFSSTDSVSEALAVKLALSLWLASQPRPESAPPASGHCKYDEAGNLRTLTVTLGE
ncbi:hypothetical protein N5D53_10950 [Pseudomonas sp. GD03862]|uniref:hypothetical protein n=1 Tax=Pseudomonas sp. GD03862 TaxID=2975391 RepID=UPI00244BC4AE|nr:hypothetical protein [Pseudomonas sp. GD03862]MDH0707034.1 hypothetical protein [Pseudomonas sp. GD03862]